MPESKSRPNILFICTDQQRPDWFSWNEDIPVRTPNAAELADGGVRFDDAVCPSPVCNPCRASIASGREYDRCGSPGNSVDYPIYRRTTLYEQLRDNANYHVIGCGKFDLCSNYPFGLSGRAGRYDIEEWGFSDAVFNPALNETVHRTDFDPDTDPTGPYTRYLSEHDLLTEHIEDYQRRREAEDPWTVTVPTPIPQEHYYDNWITRQGQSLIENAPEDQPWFAQVNLQNPHHPWDITDEMHGWYRDPDIEFPNPVNSDLDVTPEEHQEVRRNWAAMVEHLDKCLGRLIDTVEKRGELEDTVVIFTSDHGEMLGDHGQWQKLSPLHASIGVPLIAAGPTIESRKPVHSPVTTLDLTATFLDWAGGGRLPDTESQSMAPFLEGESENTPREVVYSGLSYWRMVYDGKYKLIKGYDHSKRKGGEFEDMVVHPDRARWAQYERETILHDVPESESENIADENPEKVAELEAELNAIQNWD